MATDIMRYRSTLTVLATYQYNYNNCYQLNPKRITFAEADLDRGDMALDLSYRHGQV